MKKLLLASLLIFGFIAHAGTGGPDAFGYTWIDSNEPGGPTYAWADIANPTDGIQIFGLADDNFVGPVGIQGQPFQYYWYTVSQFWIGSNGYISFNPVNIASPFPTIPTAGGPNDFIAAFMADLKFDGPNNPAEVWIGRNGDSTIISFIDVPFWTPTPPGYTGSNTFQIILNAADSSITLNYQSMSGTSFTATDTKIGIENISGAIGLQHSTGQYPANNYTIRYEYPPVVTFQVIDASVSWNNNEKNAGYFLKKDAGPYDLSTNIANTGNQSLGSFTVNGSIMNSFGGTPYSDNESVPPLSPGDDTTMVFGTQWNPTQAGYYSFTTSLSGLSGDLTPGNNTKIQEIVVIDTNTAAIELTFAEPVSNGGGISWNGGGGGIGVYYEPPTHPAKINQTSYWIDSDISGVGFSAMIYDDDGPNGEPGTLLDSVFVPSSSITTGQYTDVPTSQNIVIPDGGVYVLWLMGGVDIRLGNNTTPPFSLQCYEVLGGVWASYRDFFNTDFLIKMEYEPVYVTDIGVSEVLGPLDNPLPSGSSLVKAEVKNYGQTIINGFDISFQYGSQLVTESYQGAALAPGDSIVYNFQTQLTPVADTLDLCIWTFGTANTDSVPGNDTACVTTYGPGISIAEEEIEFSVYPNPATEVITVKTDLTDGIFELYDMTGRRVMRFAILNATTRVDVSDLASGTYYYRVTGAHQKDGKLFIE